MTYLVGGLVILVLVLAFGAFGSILFLGWKLWGAYAVIDQQQTRVAAFQEALRRPAMAVMTEEPVHMLASYLFDAKKEFIN